jgi:hypothetical protein
MSLFIQYETGDTDTRPLPLGANFWSSPAIFLDVGPGNSATDESTYVPNGNPQTITVVVQDPYTHVGDQIPNIFVELWVCDPATILGPDQALFPSEPVSGQPPPNKYLKGSGGSGGFSTAITIGGFAPWSGMSTQPGGHACLIANCYGSNNASGTPISDGQSLIGSTTADFVTLVQKNGHVAQHNIFAAPVSGSGKRHLTFPFKAVAAVPRGKEKVVLEIENVRGNDVLAKSDLAFLRKSLFRGLPLHASTAPLGAFAIDGGHGGPAKRVPVEVDAGHPVPLSMLVEVGPGDRPGGVHVFNVVQKTTAGHVQGGIHLLAVVT